MINDAEKFADEDAKLKGKVEARNELESYAYSLKNQLSDKEKLGGKLSDEETAKIEEVKMYSFFPFYCFKRTVKFHLYNFQFMFDIFR